MVAYLTAWETYHLLLLNKRINGFWPRIAVNLLGKITRGYRGRVQNIEEEMKRERQERERLKAAFEVHKEPDLPDIYSRYIEQQEPAVGKQVDLALRHSRLFAMSHEVYKYKGESKGLLGSVLNLFSRKEQEVGIVLHPHSTQSWSTMTLSPRA